MNLYFTLGRLLPPTLCRYIGPADQWVRGYVLSNDVGQGSNGRNCDTNLIAGLQRE